MRAHQRGRSEWGAAGSIPRGLDPRIPMLDLVRALPTSPRLHAWDMLPNEWLT